MYTITVGMRKRGSVRLVGMKKLASTSEAAITPARYAETRSLSMKGDGEPRRGTLSVGRSNAVDADAQSALLAEMYTRVLAAMGRKTMPRTS